MMSMRARIRAGLAAFAVGDATGVPWEGLRPEAIDLDAVPEVPVRVGWPAGATSDDTALTLLVADYLAERGAVVDEGAFLARLAGAVPGIRGVGPSTHAAVVRFRDNGALHADTGDTNGAAMRALPIGWGCPYEAAASRRRVVVGLSRTTHGAPGAIGAACVAAAMAARAVEAETIGPVVDAAIAEIHWLEGEFETTHATFKPMVEATDGVWQPNPEGVSLDAVQTMAAVIAVVRHSANHGRGLADALLSAISLGGDTDTVAALAGGVLGGTACLDADIPWISRLVLPDPQLLDAAGTNLSALRGSLAV